MGNGLNAMKMQQNHNDPLYEKPKKFKNVNFQNSLKHNYLHLFPTLGDETGKVQRMVDFYLRRSHVHNTWMINHYTANQPVIFIPE